MALVRLFSQVVAIARHAVEESLAERGVEDGLLRCFFAELVPLDLSGALVPAATLAGPLLDAQLDRPLLGDDVSPGVGAEAPAVHRLRLVKRLGPLVVGLWVGLAPVPAGSGHIRMGVTGRGAAPAVVQFVRRLAA